MKEIDFNKLTRVKDLSSAVIENLGEQLEYAEEAKVFLNDHKWCKNIVEVWYDKGWAGVLAIFLIEIVPSNDDVDNLVWIIVGDLPTAYIDIESASNGTQALQAYTDIMEDWVNAVNNGESIEDYYPIDVSPTKEYAEMLKIRIDLIREEILTQFTEDLID